MGDDTFINTSCGICWKRAQAQAEATGTDKHEIYIELMRDCKHPQPKTKVICPSCKAISNVPTNNACAEQPIDRPKCSTCFRERSVFVNLIPFDVPGVAQEEGEES